MLSAALFTMLLSAPSQEIVIPEGTILPIVLNETVTTARVEENEPILFTLAEDIRSGHRTGVVLIPRGSHVVGRVEATHRAGHFFGVARLDIRVQEIITPAGEIYDGLTTKLIDIDKKKGKKGSVGANTSIRGPSHRGRDALLLFFPPTTLFQLIVTPKRGPDVVLPVETRVRVKLMNPIYVATSRGGGS
jgi:hypothetical protein